MLSSDSKVLVACREFVEPPSGDMPNAIVIASTNVDLPAPLFPTRTVYAPRSKPLLSSSRTAGIEPHRRNRARPGGFGQRHRWIAADPA